MSGSVRHSRMILVTVKMPAGLVETLNILAEEMGKTRSELIREAVVEYIINNYGKRIDVELGITIPRRVRLTA